MRVAHIANTDYFCAFMLHAQLRAAREEGHEVDVVCGDGPLVGRLRDEGFSVHIVGNSRRIDPVADLRTLARYIALFRRRDYDLIHTHNPKINALAALAARIAGVRSVVSTLHGLYSHEGQRPWVRESWRTLERASARLADLVLCQSAEDVRTARWRRIVPDARLRRLGNGIDLAHFSPTRFSGEDRSALRRRLGVRGAAPVVGFVGRLVAEKGIPELVACMSDRPDWQLLLVGPDERGVKRDALDPRALTSLRNVTWLGLQADLPPLYAAMDVLVLPSHREGLPRTLLEGQAMARPIVATRVRGCREAVASGETGLLVPPRHPAGLLDALDALTRDPARALAIGRAGRRRAIRRFDERAVFDRISLAYRELGDPAPELPVRRTLLRSQAHLPIPRTS